MDAILGKHVRGVGHWVSAGDADLHLPVLAIADAEIPPDILVDAAPDCKRCILGPDPCSDGLEPVLENSIGFGIGQFDVFGSYRLIYVSQAREASSGLGI